ncbi:hypothetical protein [Streptomyces sp. NPDC047061]|uniref:hypothetical protein n=1 Tax=Streptomyces sp. NPDC047061 TaxID=3154605 RepID=UPI00340C26A4
MQHGVVGEDPAHGVGGGPVRGERLDPTRAAPEQAGQGLLGAAGLRRARAVITCVLLRRLAQRVADRAEHQGPFQMLAAVGGAADAEAEAVRGGPGHRLQRLVQAVPQPEGGEVERRIADTGLGAQPRVRGEPGQMAAPALTALVRGARIGVMEVVGRPPVRRRFDEQFGSLVEKVPELLR